MVTPTAVPSYRFTVTYSDSSVLSRILDVLGRYGLEPAWLFSRVSRGRFRLDVRVAGLSEARAGTLAARIEGMPTVMKVAYATA